MFNLYEYIGIEDLVMDRKQVPVPVGCLCV